MDAEVANHGEEDPSKLDGGGRERKRRRTESRPQSSRWKCPSEQHSYSSKLFEALRHVRCTSGPASESKTAQPRSRAVREAADRVLAIAAKGRSRWSRAILSKCRALKLRRKRRVLPPGCSRQRKPGPSAVPGGKLLALDRKVRTLGRLVPGCRKLSFSSLLEETSDYIAALEMQVRAMSALTEILSTLSTGSSTEGRLDSTTSSSAATSTTASTSSSIQADT